MYQQNATGVALDHEIILGIASVNDFLQNPTDQNQKVYVWILMPPFTYSKQTYP